MNTRRICGILTITALSASAARAQSGGTDTQLWTDTTYNFSLNQKKDLTLNLLNLTRVGDDVTRFNDERVGIGLTKRFGPNFSAAVSYQRREINFERDARILEDLLILNATFNAPLGENFNFVNTNLLEYREANRDFFLYRNIARLDYPTTLFKTPITPYLLTDVFYDLQEGDIPRYRYAAGLTRRFNDTFSGSLYLMRQIESGFPRLGDANIIGLSLRFDN